MTSELTGKIFEIEWWLQRELFRSLKPLERIMGEFFKGWRRKTGLLTLVMACVCMIAWLRSLAVEDRFVYFSGKHTLESLHAYNGAISWTSFNGTSESGSTTLTKAYSNWYTFPAFSNDIDFRYERSFWRFGIVPACEVNSTVFHGFMYQVSYWSIVIPLTLVSAFLLLSKPLKSTP